MENYGEKTPFTMVIEASNEAKQKIIKYIEDVERHRVVRFQETTAGALEVKFENLERPFQEDLMRKVWEYDQDAIIRNALGTLERKI